VVLITGATSGIGLATAEKVAAAGAKTVIAARTPEDLAEVKAQLEAKGGEVYAYRADLADMESIDQIIADVEKDLGGIDVLVNNAGRSIRRSVALSYDRFHDFERTMQLNYFGCLRLILRALPGMSERKGGQIINVLSIGCQVNQPRFSAYVASKSALDAFSRCAAPEFAHKNIRFTNIYMPLVKTPMIAPTKLYDHVPTLNPDQAAVLICKGIVQKPTQISTRLGTIMQALWAVSPKAMNALSNNVFRLFNDSAAAKGGPQKQVEEKPSSEAVAFAALTKGVHW
ncbi:MAG: SDR family NAD(P)-dependent oxidoreductase, partial [Pseudomonadota bacterium]